MAAIASTARPREAPPVEQPPRVIWPHGPAGDPLDVSGLDQDALHRAITVDDRDQWDYRRLAEETGRSVDRIRKWVVNAYALAHGESPDQVNDKTFITPDGRIGDSPWWYAGRARAALMTPKMGVMTPDGVAIPHRHPGRQPGATDRQTRKRWENAPARDGAPAVLAAYRKLTTRAKDPLSDRQARAELCTRFGLNRLQVAYRLKQAARRNGSTPTEVDNTALRARYLDLVAGQKNLGASGRQADNRARAALVEQTGLSRRQLAARIAAAGQGPQG